MFFLVYDLSHLLQMTMLNVLLGLWSFTFVAGDNVECSSWFMIFHIYCRWRCWMLFLVYDLSHLLQMIMLNVLLGLWSFTFIADDNVECSSWFMIFHIYCRRKCCILPPKSVTDEYLPDDIKPWTHAFGSIYGWPL